ncbi:MAG TPA: hypothetical protein VH601_20145 [Bryobacteraceae bacterium]|jgi:transposase InsO family protein
MTSRREFGRVIGSAAASLAISTSGEASDSEAKEPDSEIEARYANALRVYGDRLSDAQRKHLRRILEQNEGMLASVREFSLQNSDSPATTLRLEPAG